MCCAAALLLQATVHQHFFCVRIDPAVDDAEGGRNLVVSEVSGGQREGRGSSTRVSRTRLVHCPYNTSRSLHV